MGGKKLKTYTPALTADIVIVDELMDVPEDLYQSPIVLDEPVEAVERSFTVLDYLLCLITGLAIVVATFFIVIYITVAALHFTVLLRIYFS